MPRFPGFGLCLALALVAFVGGRQCARADLITNVGVSTTSAAGGLTQYNYTVSDESDSTITASFFFVAVDTTANLTALSAPTGWDVSYTTGDTVVEFSSPSSSFDILPGSFGLFSFESPLTPVLSTDAVAGLDADFNYFENDGSILSASVASVPEPSSALLCALGTLGVIGSRRRSKRNRRASAPRA